MAVVGRKPEVQEFKVIFGYRLSLRLIWVTRDPVANKIK